MRLLLTRAPVVQIDDGPLHGLAAGDAALLAWLAIEGPTPRARLVALLWPDKDTDAARNALRQRLFKLRALIGEDLITGTQLLTLAPGLDHDLTDAEDVLGQVDDSKLPPGEFFRWLEAQRGLRRDRVRRSLIELADAAEAAHDWADELTLAGELLALDPLSEDAHRRVMRAHYLAGDRAAAVRAFDRCVQVLKDELGTRPSEPTMQLLATIEGAVAAAVVVPKGLPASVLRPPRMVGRDAELGAAVDAWCARRVVWVIGEAGMGKSRLLQELLAQRAGAAVMTAARPGDPAVPFASLARWMRDLAVALGDAGTAVWGDVLAAPGTRNAVHRALKDLLDRAWARGIGTLLLDDLHFADAASLEWVVSFLQSEYAMPWSLALAQRHAEGDEQLVHAREALIDDGRLHECRLEPLSLGQMGELLASLVLDGIDAGAMAPALHRHTGGNPLYALETLRDMLTGARGSVVKVDGASAVLARQGSGALALPRPTSVARLIERRLARLSPQAVRLARCAAVAGQDFSIALATQVLGSAALDLSDAWDELERAQVLRDGAFAHDLIYEAALASVPRVIAAHLHGQIADGMAARDAPPARLAQHLEAAGRPLPAAQAYQRAAELAKRGAHVAEAIRLLKCAAACFERAADGAARFDALHARALLIAEHDFSKLSEEALHEVEQAAHDERQQLRAKLLRMHWLEARGQHALDAAPGVLAAAQRLGDFDLEVTAALRWGYASCSSRQAARAVELLEGYVARIDAVIDESLRFEFWRAHGFALDYAGRLRDALPSWDRALAMPGIEDRGDLVWTAMLDRAATWSKLGRVSESADAGLHALRVARSRGELPQARLAKLESIVAHRLRDVGRYAEALALLDLAGAAFLSTPLPSEQAWIEHRLAVTFQCLGQPERAWQLLAADRPELHLALGTMRVVHRADVARELGADGDAKVLIREALARIPNSDDVYYRIASLFATRIVEPDEGEVMAASLAVWAASRERLGVAMAGHVRAAACGLAQGAAARALPHVDMALRLAREAEPETFYLPELWLVCAQVMAAAGREADAAKQAAHGCEWVRRTHDRHVPDVFRHSFVHRNAVNVALAVLEARLCGA